ncbi:SIR2 family NAD-dependent protein deacylase [Sphingomonas sp. LT1P40]|uniref:SIR2 family NAD-dependent protein deacylase n=1 Tax=Alteristakelama amylovorans TaxID=3096166 RepID=UPI002FCCA2DB
MAKIMRNQLYPLDPAAAPWDPLRLAEEYRSFFGQAALDAFVRENIRDVSWHPAELHASLVDLPWADILTTNYDTLLERAARHCDRAYDPVRSEAGIAFAKAPRIIKLHGSIGTTDHYVIAEEDFRTYPIRHAAFVNLARQCFVENELCLLGFSGDDPNFLAWAGWVRDHLGSSARRIFLAGALNLSPAKRKYLEARNIAPIDVFPLVETLEREKQHSAANRLILNALHALRPVPIHDWTPASSPIDDRDADLEAQKSNLLAMLERWREERQRYPGWLICPGGRRTALRHNSEMPHADLLASLPPEIAATLMVEWCWRHETALWPIHPSFIEQVRRFADPITSSVLRKTDRLLVSSILLQHARLRGDRALFEEMVSFIEGEATPSSDALAGLRHQQALDSLHNLDFTAAEALASEINGEDPAWSLRRAAILSALGKFSEAAGTIATALNDLRERERVDRTSVWIRSRLAWALFLARLERRGRGEFEPWPERFRETRCDPWQEIEAAVQGASTERRKQREKPQSPTPNFKPGSFKLPSKTIHFGDSRVEPADTFRLLFEQAGIPARFGYVALYISERLDALELEHQPTLEWYLNLLSAGLDKGDTQLQRYFARVVIAALGAEVIAGLAKRVRHARDYWQTVLHNADAERSTFARDRLLTLLELLARLVVRFDSAQAIALHLETLALSHRLRPQFRYGDALGTLLANSFEAVAPQARASMILADLEMPLVGEDGIPEPTDWIGSGQLLRPKRIPSLRPIIATLLEAAAGTGGPRRSAISRLTALHAMDALTSDESRRFARVAWSQLDEGTPPLPADTQVFEYFWAKLPCRGRDPADTVRERVFSAANAIDRKYLGAMIRTVRSSSVRPTAEQACERFDTIVALRFKPVDPNDFIETFRAGMSGYDHQQEANFAGATLTWALAENLISADRTPERLAAIIKFASENDTLAASGALVPFLAKNTAACGELTTVVRRGLTMQDSHQVGYACDALWLWQDAHGSGPLAVPNELIDQFVSVIELRQSPALWRMLETAARLIGQSRLDHSQLQRVENALGDLIAETDYAGIDPLSELAGTVSMVREHAVKLALSLRNAGRSSDAIQSWTHLYGNDALPEVRHALSAEEA